MNDFDDAFDRERAAWLAGHGGDERGWPVEGVEGQRLRWAWEQAEFQLGKLWTQYSRLLRPRSVPLGCILEDGYRIGSFKFGRGTPLSVAFWP